MKVKLIAATLAGIFACSSAFAGEHATALGKCLYNKSDSSDKTTLTQWAFVSLGQTDAAKGIATIPDSKTQQVNTEAQSVVTKLIASSCSKEALQVALHEPTTGLQDAVAAITSEMIAEKVKSYAGNTFSGSMLPSGGSGIGAILPSSDSGKSVKSLGNIFKKK
jgi:hypothetical protein